MINEVLTKSTPASEWIKDFVDSDNPKFTGKSAAKRKQMALAAYYAKQNESYAGSQNSTAITDMNEDHLVHVSDGSKYDEVPHPKDIEHVKTGAMHHGGKWDSHSDKGAFFKFKSKEDAQHFVSHVNKCPHRTCNADLTEAVEYKGIGTDVVDKKKKLNPQPNFTTDKKQVKDFKEEKDNREYGYEGDMAISQLKTIIRHSEHLMGMLKPDTDLPEWVQSKITLATDYMQTAHDYLMSEINEEVEQIDEGENGLAAKAKKSGISLSTLKTVYKRGVAAWNSGHRPGTTPQQWGMARVNSYITKGSGTYGGADKDLHEDARLDKKEYHKGMSDSTAKARVAHWKNADKLSDSNPKAYEPAPGDKTAKTTPSVHTKKYHAMYGEAKVYDPFTKKMVPTKPIKVQAGGGATKNGVPVETGPSKYKERPSRPGDIYGKSFTEETEQIDELDKKTIGSYAKKATKDLKWQQTMRPFDAKRISNREKGIDKAIDKLTKEDVQIDELSKGLVARYANKVAKTTQTNYDKSKDKFQFSSGRQDGMKNAVKRLTKEESEQVDESSLHRQHFQMVADLIKGHESAEKRKELAHHHAELFKKANPRFDHAKFMKAAGVNEEVQIDEVSKSTLMRYIPKASRDVGSHTYAGKEAGEWASHYTRAGDWSAAEKHSKKSYADFKKANKRIAGIDTATKKLGTQKEEVQVDEAAHVYDTKTNKVHSKHDTYNKAIKAAEKLNKEHPGYDTPGNLVRDKFGVKRIDEAIAKKLPVQHAVDAVHATLGPKSATRFLSHLTPGSDKHTTWDKVNDALVKQGVQTHHIASIAQKTSRMNEEVIDESRGHKVLATFFKNREVAQRSYQGNPAKDAEVAQGGGSPADQGIAAAKADYKKMNKENVNPALMAILKKRQEAQKKKQEDKKKVSEATAPAVHAAEPKKTKSTPKEYASATIPGTKRVAHAKPDDNEVGGGTATRIAEDQYTSEYKIKSYVDPVTGENKTRKIRPHRINFKSSKMNAAPAQMTEPTKVTEDDKVYDEKWKKVKFTDFIKGAK